MDSSLKFNIKCSLTFSDMPPADETLACVQNFMDTFCSWSISRSGPSPPLTLSLKFPGVGSGMVS